MLQIIRNRAKCQVPLLVLKILTSLNPVSLADHTRYPCISVDPDEMTRNEPTHQDLTICHSFFYFRFKHLSAAVDMSDMSKFKDGRVHF